MPLAARKERLADTLRGIEPPLLYTDHQVGLGPAFMQRCVIVVSKVSCRSGLTRRMCRVIAACG